MCVQITRVGSRLVVQTGAVIIMIFAVIGALDGGRAAVHVLPGLCCIKQNSMHDDKQQTICALPCLHEVSTLFEVMCSRGHTHSPLW